jgi:hypothetical protein
MLLPAGVLDELKREHLFRLLKIDFVKRKQIAVIKRFLRDITYRAISYRKRVHNYLRISEGSILNVLLSEGFGILIIFV